MVVLQHVSQERYMGVPMHDCLPRNLRTVVCVFPEKQYQNQSWFFPEWLNSWFFSHILSVNCNRTSGSPSVWWVLCVGFAIVPAVALVCVCLLWSGFLYIQTSWLFCVFELLAMLLFWENSKWLVFLACNRSIYRISRTIRRTMIFSFNFLEKSNDECILILVIYWKNAGLVHTKISNHNLIYSS